LNALACVILAAGGSTRMGRPKPLIPLEGEPLIVRMVRVAKAAGFSDIRVVMRPEDLDVRRTLFPLDIHPIAHPGWREGLGSSIALGALSLPQGTPGVLFLACDQPAVNEGILRRLVEAFEGPASRVASAYDFTLGIPALFGSDWFPRLRTLSGDRGAKDLLREGDVKTISFEAGAFDLDTPEDLEAWMDFDGR